MGRGPKRIEEKYPEECKSFMERYADPTDRTSFNKLCKEFDFNNVTAKKMLERNNTRFIQTKVEVTKRWEDLVPTLTKLANDAFDHSLATVHELNSYQAALVGAIATDKKLAIENNGAININVIHEHRNQLDGIGEMLLDELKNRKMLSPAHVDYVEAEVETMDIDKAKQYIDSKEKESQPEDRPSNPI